MLVRSESRIRPEDSPDDVVHYRFKIQTGEAPRRVRQPHPFVPRVSKLRLAKMLLGEAFGYGWKLRDERYRKALLSRPCIYGVFSGRFGGFRPIRERCTGCMRCVQEFPDVCRVERNPEFTNFPDAYWRPKDPDAPSTNPVATVWYEAETGKIPVRGMGYKGSFAGSGWDAMWTDMSEIVRPTRDGVFGREYISTVVDLGRKPRWVEFRDNQLQVRSRTVQIPIPIIFDRLPPNLNSPSIAASIRNGAENTGTLFIADKSYGKFKLKSGDRSVPLLTGGAIFEHRKSICAAKAVELEDEAGWILDALRELNPTAPVIVRLRFSEGVESRVLELVADGVDAVHLEANYHGKSYDSDRPSFVGDGIRRVHRSLVEHGVRDEVTIIASGGITLAEHVPKAIICGADLVAIDTTILVALQVKFEGNCIFPESAHVSSVRFDPEWGAQRLTNLLGSWHDQVIEILSAMGMRDVRRLRGDVGRAMFNDDLEKEAFADIPRRA